MGRLEDLIRQNDELVVKLRQQQSDLRRRLDEIVARNEKLNEDKDNYFTDKRAYDQLVENYRALQQQIAVARAEYARTQRPAPFISGGVGYLPQRRRGQGGWYG